MQTSGPSIFLSLPRAYTPYFGEGGQTQCPKLCESCVNLVQAPSTRTELEGVKAASETLKAINYCIILNLVYEQQFLNILLVLRLPYFVFPAVIIPFNSQLSRLKGNMAWAIPILIFHLGCTIARGVWKECSLYVRDNHEKYGRLLRPTACECVTCMGQLEVCYRERSTAHGHTKGRWGGGGSWGVSARWRWRLTSRPAYFRGGPGESFHRIMMSRSHWKTFRPFPTKPRSSLSTPETNLLGDCSHCAHIAAANLCYELFFFLLCFIIINNHTPV